MNEYMQEKKNALMRYLLYVPVLVVPLVFTLYTFDTFEINKIFLFKLTVLISVLFAIIYFYRSGSFTVPVNVFTIILLLMLICMCISLFFSQSSLMGMTEVSVFFYLYIYLILMLVFFNKDDINRLFVLVPATSFLISLYTVFQHFGIDFVVWYPRELVSKRAIGTLGNPIFLAFFLTMTLPFSLKMIFSRKNERLIAGLIISALQMLAVYFTYSRAGLAACLLAAAGFLFFMIMKKEFRARSFVLLLCGFLILLSVLFFYKDPVFKKTSVLYGNIIKRTDLNMRTRFFLWDAAFSLIAVNPSCGIGPNLFSFRYLPYREKEPPETHGRFSLPQYVHNDFLQAGVDYGIPVLILNISLVLFFMVRCIFVCSSSSGNDAYLEAAALFCSGTAFLVNSFFAFATIDNRIMWFFLLGCISLVGADVKKYHLNFSEKKKVSFWIAAVFFMVVLVFPVTQEIKTWLADVYYKKGMLCSENGYNAAGMKFFLKAMRLNPLNEEYYILTGKMLEKDVLKNYSPGRARAASALYKGATDLNPFNPYHYADRARILRVIGNMENKPDYYRYSLESYAKSIEMDPYNSPLLNDFALTFMACGNDKAAENCLKEALRIYPENESAANNLRILKNGIKKRTGETEK
jgi:O-antigen ligase